MSDNSFDELTGLIDFTHVSSLRRNYSDDEIKRQAVALSSQFEFIKNKIDSDIGVIIERLKRCSPLRTLVNATNLVMWPLINKVSESQLDPGVCQFVRYIEYVQSIFVTHKLSNKEDILEDDTFISETLSLIKDLYKNSAIFVNVLGAKLYIEDKYSDEEIDYIIESYQMSFVRGHRYRFQQLKNIKVLLQPHSDELLNLYGLTSEELLCGLEKLEVSLSSGKFDALSQFCAETDIAMDSDDLDEYLKKIQCDMDNPLWSISDRAFGVAVYDVKQVTGWPDKFSKSLSFFFFLLSSTSNVDKSDFDNWPFKDLPAQKKPFINIDGVVYCFDYYNLFDNIYRVVQKTIKQKDSTYATKWAKLQQEASENLVASMFRKLLPDSEVYVSNYYKDENHPNQFDENDILIIYDTCVLIVEVKAGSFTYTSAVTDFQAHLNSLDALIQKADYQCNRTLNYIKQSSIANFYKNNSKKSELKFSIDKKKYANFFTFCITVDNFNAVEAKIDKARFLHINSGSLAINIDDLDIYAEYFDSPLIFLHFLKVRQAASNNSVLYLNDELDHLGLYIEHNDYNRYVSSLSNDNDHLFAFGYRRNLDAYFAGIHDERLKIDKPEQNLPDIIVQILLFLESRQLPNRVDFANFLLDISTKGKKDLNDFISYVVGREKLSKSMCPFALDGDFFLCCFVMIPRITTMPKRLIDLHTYALLKSRNKVEGWQVILSYDDDCCITDIAFKIYHYFDFEKDKFTESEILDYSESIKSTRKIKYLNKDYDNSYL